MSVVAADGTVTPRTYSPSADAPADCFYVYPTISLDPNANSDMIPGPDEEIRAAINQATPLTEACRLWVPVYRQATLKAITEPTPVGPEVFPTAFGDVKAAFETYLASVPSDRGFALYGHSQGASHLLQLLREVIDQDEELRERLVAAILLGATVGVPAGADVGGDLANIPVCRTSVQFGCLISYVSFRATAPPPPDAFMGRPPDGQVAVCSNPAAPQGGSAPLDPIFRVTPVVVPATPPFADKAATATITTPAISLPGLVSGECVVREGFSYLEVTVNGDPQDPRTDDIGGDTTPQLGLHFVDPELTLGNLVQTVGEHARGLGRSADLGIPATG